MAWTQSDLDALKAAIAAGGAVQSVTFSDQTMTFRSLDQMLRLLSVMQREVSGRSGTRYGATSKGC